ncbi:MAG: putative cobaltochelatase [Syntrophobacteraceae bacterium]|nr:putative cobaltochelatase [Syntrophobacteraceae bacterium]
MTVIHSRVRNRANRIYPFSAIVGQEPMKLALLLNAVEPLVGGVLIRGEKGTAKSTAVRGLAALLPEIETIAGCPFYCDPTRPEEWCPECRDRPSPPEVLRMRTRVVTLPLNATEDMLIGGLDFSATLRQGRCAVQPGLLARAHRGILYVDEVNLLDDHLVDVILDAAASGENVVEREGIAFRHPTRFALVGTMNPEEGALRPQLLDRFGLCVDVVSEEDPAVRVELMERRDLFELDPDRFPRGFADQERRTARRIQRARALLPSMGLEPHIRSFIGELTLGHHVAGHRADLVMARAACAHAAWEGRHRVEIEDVLTVAEMALVHRRRDPLPSPPPPPPPPPPRGEEEAPPKDTNPASYPPDGNPPPPRDRDPSPGMSAGSKADDPREPAGNEGGDQVFGVGPVFTVKRILPPVDRLVRRGSGRRARTRTSHKQGRYVRSRFREDCRDLALDATLRAAAPYQHRRRRNSRMAVVVHRRDWREKVREKRIGSFILFLVDASGSMGARGRMAASKGAVMSLLLDAYQKRDRVAMVAFRRREATVLLPPTSSIELAGKLLSGLPVGGRTPLSAGMAKGFEILQKQLRRDPNLRPLAILITDGKSNAAMGDGPPMEEALRVAAHLGQDPRIHWIVVDTEEPGMVRFELAYRLAQALGGEYFRIDGLRAADLVNVVKGHTG